MTKVLLPQSYTEPLFERIRSSHRALNRAVGDGGAQNKWLLVNSFLAAFEHLRRPAGYQLACVVTPRYMDSESRMMLVKTDLPTLPAIPDAVARWEYDFSFVKRVDTRPAELPEWIEWDVAGHIESDGSPESYFERSMFNRWIEQLLNFGHPVWWPSYEILFGDEDSATRLASCQEDGVIPLSAADVAPTVEMDGTTVTVRFYAYTQYVEERIEEYRDTYQEGRWASASFTQIGRGRYGYMV